MIKLAIISDDPGRGGTYRVAADIVDGLDKAVYDVRWFFLCEKTQSTPSGAYLGLPSIEIDYSLKSYLRLAVFPKVCEKSYPPLNAALAEFKPDIIHFHTHVIQLSLIRGLQNLHAQLIFTDHSQRIRQEELPYLKQYLMTKIYRHLFRRTKVIFVSKYAYKTAINLGYGIKEKDFLITNSVDINKFSPNQDSKDTDILKVVYLSRIHHAKGHHQLLNAWKRLPKRNKLSLHLYGYEADGGCVKNRIEQEKFPNPVYYKGITSSPEDVLQGANVGVFPSFREGLPLALLEMMSCGLPVIASDIPEIKNIITDGVDGLLFECGNEKDLAKKLIQLINNISLREQLKNEARITVKKYYGESIAEKYNEYYQRILNGSIEKCLV